MKHPLEIAMDRTARGCARCSLQRFLALSRVLGWIYGHVIRHRRAYVLRTLARCFPDQPVGERRRLASAMYRHLALTVLETFRLAGGKRDEYEARTEILGIGHLHDVLDKGKGALALTAHLGNWEWMGGLGVLSGYGLNVIVKPIRHPAVHSFWARMREEMGMKTLYPRQSYRECLRILRKNEILGFMLDVNRPRQGGIFVDFFHRPACTSPGLALLSAQSGAPVIPIFARRLPDGRHQIRIYPAFSPPLDRTPGTVHDATQVYTRRIEDEIRQCPEQWLWIHRRWKTQPLAGSGISDPGNPSN